MESGKERTDISKSFNRVLSSTKTTPCYCLLEEYKNDICKILNISFKINPIDYYTEDIIICTKKGSIVNISRRKTPACCGSFSFTVTEMVIKKGDSKGIKAIIAMVNLFLLKSKLNDIRNQAIFFMKKRSATVERMFMRDFNLLKVRKLGGGSGSPGYIGTVDTSRISINGNRAVICNNLIEICRNEY